MVSEPAKMGENGLVMTVVCHSCHILYLAIILHVRILLLSLAPCFLTSVLNACLCLNVFGWGPLPGLVRNESALTGTFLPGST